MVLNGPFLAKEREEEALETLIPEKNRKQGVCYAVTADGIEVPVIDITNTRFRVEMGVRSSRSPLRRPCGT